MRGDRYPPLLSPVFASAGTKAPLNRQKNRQDDSWRERAGFGSHSVNDNRMQFHDPIDLERTNADERQ
jgi:hypothetical protein